MGGERRFDAEITLQRTLAPNGTRLSLDPVKVRTEVAGRIPEWNSRPMMGRSVGRPLSIDPSSISSMDLYAIRLLQGL
jgi:hypothetical protein